MAFKLPPTSGEALALAIQFLVGAFLFVILTGVAALLHVLVEVCRHYAILPDLIAWGMSALEFLVWAADVVCFALFIVVEVWRFLVIMWDALRG